jgi:protein SCO1
MGCFRLLASRGQEFPKRHPGGCAAGVFGSCRSSNSSHRAIDGTAVPANQAGPAGSVFRLFPMPASTRSPYGWIVHLVCAAGLALGIAGCAADNERVFKVRGVVRAPYADGTIRIQHEEIPGFMPAMTMPFHADAADAGDLAPGDQVEFEFRVGERSKATKFRKLGTVAPTRSGQSQAPHTPVRRLREGEAVPEFSLVDQDNQRVTQADFQGRSTVVSFIFTRCPVPEFCPLIAKKLNMLQAQLPESAGSDGNVRILAISIDPEHDRPAVLRDYGRAVGADFARWRFATGEPEQVDTLARLFAVRIERNGSSLDHTLATALIGPDGKVVEIWRGNAWKPEEIRARIAGRNSAVETAVRSD